MSLGNIRRQTGDRGIMPEQIISEQTVPGTDVTVTVSRKTSLVDGKVYFLTTRHPGTCDFVNYLQCGRDTEAEAHAEAEFLWNDTVTRRDRRAKADLEMIITVCQLNAGVSAPDAYGRIAELAKSLLDRLPKS